MSQTGAISVEVDNENDINKIDVIITYSNEDHSFVGWNVEDEDEGQLKSEFSLKIFSYESVSRMCVSDNKKFAYIVDYGNIGKL